MSANYTTPLHLGKVKYYYTCNRTDWWNVAPS